MFLFEFHNVRKQDILTSIIGWESFYGAGVREKLEIDGEITFEYHNIKILCLYCKLVINMNIPDGMFMVMFIF